MSNSHSGTLCLPGQRTLSYEISIQCSDRKGCDAQWDLISLNSLPSGDAINFAALSASDQRALERQFDEIASEQGPEAWLDDQLARADAYMDALKDGD